MAKKLRGPDLALGIAVRDVPEGGMIAGHVGGEEIVLVRRGREFFAIGAHCTHYHGPLGKGLVVGDTVRCPWHHACFSLRTGEAIRAPALDPIACWRIERVGDTVFVREKLGDLARPPLRSVRPSGPAPSSIVIIGGGAAGLAAADMLRREGYDGALTMVSADEAPPYDRPNLSKDYLAGTAKADWIPLQPPEFYRERDIDLVLGTRVTAIDPSGRRVEAEGGRVWPFGALLVATGAEPVRIDIPGRPAMPIRYLRTFADSQAIVDRVGSAKRALVIGASFIGLEVAASLRARDVDVHVVAPEREPLERVMGAEVGRFVRGLHEDEGVTFHLGTKVGQIEGETVTLDDGTTVQADLVVAGVGVKPLVGLAERAGLAVDRGITVDEYLETSARGVFAAGDAARWPDPHTGSRIRVEHWVVAERQGQTAARNMIGLRERFDAVPYFWSQHYDTIINYVGHAEAWDAADIDGKLADQDCRVTYTKGGRTLAVATISRDIESLEAEVELEGQAAPAGD